MYPVPAYSTLGWMNWAGGDPLLSTFIGYPEGELARIVFHELAHQVLYVAGDTVFNESYAPPRPSSALAGRCGCSAKPASRPAASTRSSMGGARTSAHWLSTPAAR